MAEVTRRNLVVRGLRTRVLDSGPQDAGEAVVLVHGAPGSADAWARLQTAVGAFARAVAFDLPGYGEADRPDDFEHSVGAYAEFIGAVIASLGISRAHLVMNDIGGSALVWAADHPDAFASSVQIDTASSIRCIPGIQLGAFSAHRSSVVSQNASVDPR
jgi:pimeloyl-ACP methyl ester carboxylesterase